MEAELLRAVIQSVRPAQEKLDEMVRKAGGEEPLYTSYRMTKREYLDFKARWGFQ
jgi:hypothetical protein